VRRSRLEGCAPVFLAALVAVALLLAVWQCGLLTGLPALLAPGSAGRTNVLLLGIDRRAGTGWAYRTDTIIVLTADRQAGTAGMLSIPRDLQVPIPTHGEDRINTANVYGYLGDYPGGGPALLEATILANFGIPIHGYAMIDFQTFVSLVDALGGIDVNVPQTLHDTRYPDPRPGDPYAYKTVHFDPGWQHMNGQRALVYARSRMSTTDFDRAARQQLILLAIRDKVLSPGMLLRWPRLVAIVRDGVQTDLGSQQMVALALLAAQVDAASLKQVVLEPPLVYGYRRADGAAVQLPNWDLINPVIRDLFGSP
jgi:LCP family protein required for cell wall assembly